MQGGCSCVFCGNLLSANEFGRQDSCVKCGRDTRICKNCKHYDRNAHNECRENQADRVVEKERANFCDYFSPAMGRNAAGTLGNDPRAQARAAAEALFKKK